MKNKQQDSSVKLIRLQKQLDKLGSILDDDITHERHQLVMKKMREVWLKIQEEKND